MEHKTTSKQHTDLFEEVERPAYIHIDLDRLCENVRIMRGLCENKDIGVIAAIKGGAFGHGSVAVGRHLEKIGVERLAVANVDEAIHLRNYNITLPIHVLGSVQAWEMSRCLQYDLVPTVSDQVAVEGMAQALKALPRQQCNGVTENGKRSHPPIAAVHIKIDTGLSRNGCQPEDFTSLYKYCEECDVPVEGVMTQFADSWANEEMTRKQLKTFLSCVEPYRSQLKLSVANSGAVLNNIGTDLDFIRLGISIYGLPPGEGLEKFKSFGLRPIASMHVMATLVKYLRRGRRVGYCARWTCNEDTWLAILPLGYTDGYFFQLGSSTDRPKGYVIRDSTGEKCAVAGGVSMDSIMVKLSSKPRPKETFTVLTADFDLDTSAAGIAYKLASPSAEMVSRFSVRCPRVYKEDGKRVVVPVNFNERY